MAKAIPIIGIIGALLATLTATILIDIAPAAVGIITLGCGIYFAISKDWRRMAPGIATAIVSILGILGVIGSVGGEDGALEFPISVGIGTALIIAAGLELAVTSALYTMEREPKWLSYVWLGAAGLAFIMALVMNGDLGDQSTTGAFVVAALSLVTLGAPIQMMRSE